MIGRQVAQVRRPDDGRRVADRLNAHAEGGDDSPQLICQVGTALAGEVLSPDDVDRHGRLGDRSRLRATADDNQFLACDAQLQLDRNLALGLMHEFFRDLEDGCGDDDRMRTRAKITENRGIRHRGIQRIQNLYTETLTSDEVLGEYDSGKQ